MSRQRSFDQLFYAYDKARAQAKDAKTTQDALNVEIKALLEEQKLDTVDAVEYTCVYKFEKDKEVETFDEEKFAEKDPKKYKQYTDLMNEMKAITKKYTKKVTTKGARKLMITRKNESEE